MPNVIVFGDDWVINHRLAVSQEVCKVFKSVTTVLLLLILLKNDTSNSYFISAYSSVTTPRYMNLSTLANLLSIIQY